MTLRSLFLKFGIKGDILTKLTQIEKKVDNVKVGMLGFSAVVGTATAIIGKFVYEAAKIEQVEIAFEVMTGSVEKGKEMLNDMFQLARYTPFRIPGVIEASRTLMSMGIESKKMVPTLTKIGDVASGLNVPLMQLALSFGKVKAAGYLTGFELQNLRRAGVPLMQELEKVTGKSSGDIMHMIRKQQISFQIFEQAWDRLTDKGGRFNNMMMRQSATFLGILSNIADFIQILVIDSGQKLLPVSRKIANQFLLILEMHKKIIKTKIEDFFTNLSGKIEILNKGLLKLFFRTIEIGSQLGGLDKIIKGILILISGMTAFKFLALLGKISSKTLNFFTLAQLKLALLGVALLSIMLLFEDFMGFLDGKESLIGRLIDKFGKKFPDAFKAISESMKALKKEIEGITLYWIGFLNQDTKMMSYALSQLSDAYKQFQEEGKRREVEPIKYSAAGFIEKPGFMLKALGRESGQSIMEGLSSLWKDWSKIAQIERIPTDSSKALIKNITNKNDIKSPITINLNTNGQNIDDGIIKKLGIHLKMQLGEFWRENYAFIESKQE